MTNLIFFNQRFPFNKARELEDMDEEGEEAEKKLIESINAIVFNFINNKY